MDTKEVTVSGVDDDGQPVRRSATLIVCPDCKGEAFFIFNVPAGSTLHNHLQCATCQTTFCQAGKCPLE